MSHFFSPTIIKKIPNKIQRKKEETKYDSSFAINTNLKNNLTKNNDISNKKRKIRNSNSYMESFLSKRRSAADHAQSKRSLSNNKCDINIDELIINDRKNDNQKESNNIQLIENKDDKNCNNNNNIIEISQKNTFHNYKNNFFQEKIKKSLNNNFDKKDGIQTNLNKYIYKNNNIIVNRNNCYNYFSNYLTDISDINKIKSIKKELKNQNKEAFLFNEELNNKKENDCNLINNKKIINDNHNYFNSLENNYCEPNDPDELFKPQLPDDIKTDLYNYKQFFNNNNMNTNSNNNLLTLTQNGNMIKINKIINYSNNNTESKKFNVDEISTIKFHQPSVSNETESQILFQEKFNNNRNEILFNKTNYSYRSNLLKNAYKIMNNITDNANEPPLSAKNNNHIKDFNNTIKNNRIINFSSENFNFILNNNNINN